MIYYDMYADVRPAVLDAFVGEREMGRLVTIGGGGWPHIGLYPFVYTGDAVEMHLNRADEQLADLRINSRCLFEIDDVLGVIPSYWVDAENAVMATAYHRTIVFECEAAVSDDPAVLAEQQTRLLARYQPEGGFRPLTPADPLYRGAIAHIAALRLDIRARRAKFKLAQNRSLETRASIVAALRGRGRANDARAADALQWAIDHNTP